MLKRILFGAPAKCNQELARKRLLRKHSGLIESEGSAFIGKTYRAISETFDRQI